MTQFAEKSPLPNNKLCGCSSRKQFVLPDLVANENTKVTVLGKDHRQERYQDKITMKIDYENTDEGLSMDVPRHQWLYNWRNCSKAVVLRFENVDFNK